MSIAAGPDIDYSASIIFKYDMSNTISSWLGATTTNLITTNPLPTVGSTTGYSAAGGTGNPITYDASKEAIYWQRNTYEPWGAYCPNSTNFTGTLNTSLQYTASFEWYSESEFASSLFSWELTDGPAINYVAGANIVSNSVSIGGGWSRFSFTFTPAITGTNANFRVIVGPQGTLKTHFWWRKLQLQQSSFRTPFVEGTRSNTQNILDQTLRSTITANSLTYNSNNTFSFAAGTTVPISIPLSTALNKTEGSLNMWVFPTAYSGSNGLFVNRDNATENAADWLWAGMWNNGTTFYFRAGDGAACCNNDLTITGSTNIPLNTWTNVCITWKSSNTAVIYINGRSAASRNISSIPATNPTATGSIGLGHLSAGTASWVGQIGYTEIYNTQISASQVLQNFNAIRGRYGI